MPMQKFGFWTILTLVALRMGIGWHFFAEGAEKFKSKKGGEPFTSVPFLNAAKGPWADFYKSMIPDRLGHERLQQPEVTLGIWKGYVDEVGRYYGFDDKQSAAAERLLQLYKERLDSFLVTNKAEIHEYFLEVERWQKASTEKLRDVPFQRDRLAKMESDLRGKGGPWIQGVTTLEKELQLELRELANDIQRKRAPLPLTNRFLPASDTNVKWMNLIVGGLLIVGLLTRPAAIVAILFLFSVMVTQPPWVPGANLMYFYYQIVEVLALCLLIASAAGRFAGLDYVVHALWSRCCAPKTT